MYIYVHLCIFMYVYLCIFMNIYVYLCMYIYEHLCIFMYVYLCIIMYVYLCIFYVYLCRFMYICNNTYFSCDISGTLIMTIYGLPWLVLVLVPLVPVFHWLQWIYRLTARELKRLSSATLSPVYSHFNETLLGLTTIRSFRAVPRSVLCTKSRKGLIF
jgi:ABC-type multidrug transport system fused ATPase/permease subunit